MSSFPTYQELVAKATQPSDEELAQRNIGLEFTSKVVIDALMQNPTLKSVTIKSGDISKAIVKATGGQGKGQGLTPKVKGLIAAEIGTRGWKVDTEKGDFVLTPAGKKRGGRPKMTDAEKLAAKAKRDAKNAAVETATAPAVESPTAEAVTA